MNYKNIVIYKDGSEKIELNNLADVLTNLHRYYIIHGDNVGYIVLVVYRVAQCKEEIKKDLTNFRTYKTEGNYFEVRNNLEAWGEEKIEIYNLENFEQVLCSNTTLKTGMLVERGISSSNLYILKNGELHTLQRTETLFQSCIESITLKDWKQTRIFRDFNYKSLEGFTLEEQKKQLVSFFKKVVSKRKKYKLKFNIELPNKDFINIIQDLRSGKHKNGAINIYQVNKGFYHSIARGVSISEEDQRCIQEKRLVLVALTVIITYDFEWDWLLNKDGSYSSSKVKIITTELFVPGTGYRESKMFRGHYCDEDFLEYISNMSNMYEKKYGLKTYCIAHNASSTEHVLLLGMFMKFIKYNNYSLKFKHVNGTKIYSFRWKNIEFRDSLLFCNQSLEKYAESMNVSGKKKIDIDWDTVKWDNATSEMLEYAQQDSKTLMDCIIEHNKIFGKILEIEGMFWFDFKSGSSISKYYLLKDNTELMYNNKNISQQLIYYYYGGRNEAFFLGNNEDFKNYYNKKNNLNNESLIYKALALKIDCNSAYPKQMTKKLPGNFLRIETSLDKIDKENEAFVILGILKYLPSYWKKFNYSLVAIREDNNKLIFPNFSVGSYVFIWDFELEAIKDYVDIQISQVLVFSKKTYFKEKMEKSYNLRIKANTEAEKAVRKFIMNGGYGSLGIKCERETMMLAKGTHIERTIKSKKHIKIYDLPDHVLLNWSMMSYKEISDVCGIVQQASYITSLARLDLWNKMEELTSLDYKVVYTDTDCIVAVDTQNKSVRQIKKDIKDIVGNKLGEWKLEGIAEKWCVQGLKMYYFKDLLTNEEYIRCKGVKKPKIDNNYKFYREQETELWVREDRTSIKRKDVIKILTFEYDKGYTNSNGEIKPLLR